MAELNEKLLGRILKVVIDRKEDEYYAGRTEFDSPEVDQEVLIPAEYNLVPGNFYNIKITGSEDFDLYGIPSDL
jgi:ribosomal protein S12 methylthiotransferase